MLVSIALAPGVLSPPAAHPPLVIRSLASVLHAVAQNGILICHSPAALRAALVQAAAAMPGPAAQRLQLVAADIAKNIERYAASPAGGPPGPSAGINPCSPCVTAARSCHCDVVIALNDSERQQCIDAGAPPELVILVEEFVGSACDARRSAWLAAQRLDTLDAPSAEMLVGGAVRFAKKIVVADKMIGVSAKDGNSRVTKHLRGVSYIVNAWHRLSPYAAGTLDVEIVSVAGGSGSRAGFIDPATTRTTIVNAMRQLDSGRKIGELTITLKQDGEPQVFNDRVLTCGTRAWGIHHGFDDLGKLGNVTPNNRRRPTRIEPASDALATTFRDILALRDASPPERHAS